MGIKNRIIKERKKRIWRKRNAHNGTHYDNILDLSCVEVGNYTYGPMTVIMSRRDVHLKIGNYCSIASGVKFILSSEHALNRISTFPFRTNFVEEGLEGESKGDIVVDDDVWFGCNALIMSGVHIGQGAVVAAGAVVSKDVPPYAVVAGVPAKIIKFRFSQSLINELLKLDYSQLHQEDIIEHIEELYDEIILPEQLDWFPKKK